MEQCPARKKAPPDQPGVEESRPAPEAVVAQLQAILSCSRFANAEKQKGFLAFVVNEALAGRGQELKEAVLGALIYGRRQDYDPKIDAIVRVEAARLRTKLGQYYVEEGCNDPVRIEIPKGGYTPAFSRNKTPPRNVAAPAPRRLPVWASTAAGVFVLAALSLPSRLTPEPGGFALSVQATENLTGDSALNPFCAGLPEQLLSKLSSTPGIVVFQRNAQAPKQPIFRLETALHRSGSRLQVTAKLIGVTPEKPILMTATYTTERDGIERFQNSVSELLARTVGANFGGLGEADLRRRQGQLATAKQLCVQGRAEWSTGRKTGAQKAVALFEKAIAISPSYSEAHAWLAAAAWFLADLEDGAHSRRLAQARAAAAQAIVLDDRIAIAHATLGNILLFKDANLPDAERELRRAMELEPGDDGHTRWYALAASMRGHQKRASDELEFARLLSPDSELVQAESGRLAIDLGQWDDAAKFTRRALELAPRHRLAHYNLGRIYEHRREYEKAVASYRACGTALEWDIDCEAAAMAVLTISESRKQIEGAARPPTWTGRALVWLRRGNPDKAFKSLEQARNRHERGFALGFHDERFAIARGEKRFRELWELSGLRLFQD